MDAPGVCTGSSRTFWERIAETRWGRYITQIEEAALSFACNAVDKPGTFLEIGCEGGRWSARLIEAGWSAVCVDIDPKTLAACQARLPNARCILTSPDQRRLPCSEKTMRLVLCVEVFPVADSDWLPREAFRVLEPGGVLLCVALNRSSLRSLASRALGRDKKENPPYYRRSYNSIRRAMRTAGFRFLMERGLCWAPFSRSSHSPLIPAALKVERALGLERLVRWSPWIVFVAQKPVL
jgi:SAM-dependent methyltransferase